MSLFRFRIVTPCFVGRMPRIVLWLGLFVSGRQGRVEVFLVKY